jgi:hypothetical protein
MILHYAVALIAFTVSLAGTTLAVRWSPLNPSD